MRSEENINSELQQLEAHRRRLADLLTQKAKFGVYTPSYVHQDIREARTDIQDIKDRLRDWGMQVEDLPSDYDWRSISGEKQTGQSEKRDEVVQNVLSVIKIFLETMNDPVLVSQACIGLGAMLVVVAWFALPWLEKESLARFVRDHQSLIGSSNAAWFLPVLKSPLTAVALVWSLPILPHWLRFVLFLPVLPALGGGLLFCLGFSKSTAQLRAVCIGSLGLFGIAVLALLLLAFQLSTLNRLGQDHTTQLGLILIEANSQLGPGLSFCLSGLMLIVAGTVMPALGRIREDSRSGAKVNSEHNAVDHEKCKM
jgi:hypothetical protein